MSSAEELLSISLLLLMDTYITYAYVEFVSVSGFSVHEFI